MGCPDDLSMRPKFVLAWVVEKGVEFPGLGNGGRALFVEHPQRGWEMPGGHLEDGELAEEALLRELAEECEVSGEVVAWNYDFYPGGWVGLVLVDSTTEESWHVKDDKVSLVQWWDEVPPVKTWSRDEFTGLSQWVAEQLANH